MQRLARKLDEQAIPFQSVTGKTITKEEVLSAAHHQSLAPRAACFVC